MSTENIFSPTSGAQDQAPPVPPSDNNSNSANDQKPYLVVGDRAYHSPDDVVKKISNADEHIKTLETESAQLREAIKRHEEALANSANIDKLMERLNDVASNSNPGDPRGDASAAPIDITKQVEEVLTTRERTRIENDNLAIAQAPFLEGAKGDTKVAANTLAAACQEVGLSLEDAQSLAKKSPNAFFRMLGIDSSNNKATPSVNTDVASSENRRNSNANPALNSSNFTPGSYADLKQQWKNATDSRVKSNIMGQIDVKMQEDPNFRNTR